MVDVDGVLDLGLRMEDLQREFFDVYWEDVVLGRVMLAEPLGPVLETIAPHLTVDQLIDYWFRQDSRLDREFMRELSEIRSTGVRVYLATNQEHRRAGYLMKDLGLAEHIDDIYYSGQMGAKKPSQEFFDRVASTMSCVASELLLIDDTPANIRAADAAGWQTLHWTGKESPTMVWDALQKPPLPKLL